MSDPLTGRPWQALARWQENLSVVAGAGAALLGLAVMVGWHAHAPTLTRVTPSVRPMVYMTALCFLLCGSALVALRFEHRRFAGLAAAAAGLMGAERLVEYVLRVESGLDRALSPAFARSNLLQTQMARLTALGFLLAGLAILLAASARPFRLRSRLVGLAGSVVFSVGAIFVLLYLAGTSAHIWGSLTGMAPHTAGGMALLGAGILLLAWREDVRSGHPSPTWLPVLVLIGGLTATLWLWQAQVAEQRAFLDRALRLQTDGLRNELAAELKSQRLALERMARRWEVRGSVPRLEWESDARLYVAHNPGYQAIEWVDPSLTVRWVVPTSGNESAVNQNLGAEERTRQALEAARLRGAVTLTRPVALGKWGVGFLACAPISQGQTFGGFIAAVFRFDTFLDSVWRDELAAGYSVSLSDNGREIYGRRSASLPRDVSAQEATLDLEGLSLRLRIWPSRELLSSRSSLPSVALFGGFFSSCLLALSILLAQAAQRRASEAEAARRALEAEVLERQKKEAEIAERTRLAAFAADVGAALTRGSSLQDALSRCAEAMIRHLGGSAASIWGLDEKENVLDLRGSAWAGRPLFGPEARVSVGDFRIGAIARDRKPALVDLTAGQEREDDKDWARQKGVVAFAGYPLLVEDRVVGVMALFADRPLTEAALHAMASVADEIALGIDRARAAEELRQSEARIRSILDNMLGGLITVDRSGVIESVNPAAEQIFGYGTDELVGQHLAILVPESVAPDRQTFLKTAFPKAIGRVTEWEGRRKNGEAFPFELSMFEFHTPEGSLFAGNIRDISERKEVDRMKKEFISTVSHELRTPLTAIRGSLGLLAGGVAGALPKEAEGLVGIALRNSERLVLLVNDILDLERIESGRMEFRPEVAELAPLVESALASNRAYADQYGVSSLFRDFALGARVRLDRDRLAQVLANLLSNAAKFSPRGETVVVAVNRLGKKLRLSVSDRGPGIPEEFRSRIFQRFQQADSSDARQKAGSGLGLSISKSIVEKLGGQIGFETEAGVGTSFFVDLPEWGAGPEAIALRALPAGARVLVCDDDTVDARWLSGILEGDGFTTEIAASAREARLLLEKNRYDIMTLDLLLPDEDGLSLLRDLRAREETRSLPVVVVSVSADRRHEEWTGDAVALVEWIQKPADRAALTEAIRRAIGAARGNRRRILHVEDDPDVLAIVSALLREEARVVPAVTLKEARERLEEEAFDLVLLDVEMPDGSGLELLPLLRVPVVIFSAHEITRRWAESMAAVLLKSRATNEKLLETIRGLLHPTGDEAPTPGARAVE